MQSKVHVSTPATLEIIGMKRTLQSLRSSKLLHRMPINCLLGFIDNFKDEIKAIVDRATHFEFDWDGVEKSRLFQTRLQKRRRDARNAADVDDDWKKDAGEKATRIWEWWRPVIRNEAEFPCFSLALKIIGTLQVSSCAVERVFSQLQVIRDVCGDHIIRGYP